LVYLAPRQTHLGLSGTSGRAAGGEQGCRSHKDQQVAA
jgi:hypothetical protein